MVSLKQDPKEKAPDYSQDACQRLGDARAQKSVVEQDLREAYFFTRPRLSRQVSSMSKPTTTLDRDVDELATGIGAEVSEDFATEVIAAFFPLGQRWVVSSGEAARVDGADDDDIAELQDDIEKYDLTVFAAINGSNFGSEIAETLDPDASIGTMALWITNPGAGRPHRVEHVPTQELEINIGPDGCIDDRFRVRHVKYRSLRSVIGKDVVLPAAIENKIKRQPGDYAEVVWCFWRDWDIPEDDRYVHVLLVDNKQVHYDHFVGEGCLPLVVFRFSPDKLHAWGNGPAIKSLQELRVLDTITATTQDACEVALNPPIWYPDDGVVNFDSGLEPGHAYAKRPGGNAGDFGSLAFMGSPDIGFYTATDLERRVKRKFFADYPEQKGDTPPTATQWTDEMVRAQRRIGTPGAKFWREGPYEIYRRFEFLLKADSKIEEVKFNNKPLTLTPNNPATQAQDNQKLQVATQLLGLVKNFFPQTSQAAIDEMATIEAMQKLVKDEVIKLRSKADAQKLVQQVLGAAQQVSGGGNAQTPTAQ
ncbi:portal protein [Rhizobium rhizogenes]|uniref:portal protein n=1 Tax=Rhizobium rhizogenes TaxID=359 RepID=UPI00157259BC|nr:portal protein [Rhizobium rhizogenes]NTG94249.1 phage tail protein [Rhizobium rhizogenes]